MALVAGVILASGLAVLLSSVNVYLRDTQHLIEVILTAWFWACPIVYSYRDGRGQAGPAGLTWVYFLNPMTPLVLAFQRCLYNKPSYVAQRRQSSQVLPQHGYLWYAVLDLGVLLVSPSSCSSSPWPSSAGWRATSPRSSERVSDFAVDVRNVSKRFRLAHGQYNSLKERLIHGGKRKSTEDFWALDEVSLDVQRGGDRRHPRAATARASRRCSSASAACSQPTTGEVVVRGKLAGLLELGAGFQQDLTGRENIYLNGSLLGDVQEGSRQGLRRHRGLLRAWRSSSTAR